jgi:hypothetical protein
MKLDYGVIIVLIAVLIFYLRLIVLQRQRVKRYQNFQTRAREEARKTKGKKKKAVEPPPSASDQLGFRISNWYLLAVGILIILFGAFMGFSPYFNATVRSLWWAPFVVGVFLMNYTIR